MKIWLLTSIFSACRWIHPQCLLKFENNFYPLLDGCQNTFLPEIFESAAVCRNSLIFWINLNKLIDTLWSVTHHVMSIHMNTPLSVYGLKGVISMSTIILDDFLLRFIFILFHTVFHLWWMTNSITYTKRVKWNSLLNSNSVFFLL